MLPSDRLQSNRFELKYMIDEGRAEAVRDFVRSYLGPDEYMDPRQPNGYMVYSLYLDSPDLLLCKATEDGEKNRFKLRIRYYDYEPGSPVFFEIKRRVSDAILKSRAAVNRASAADLIAGAGAREDHLLKASAKAMTDLGTFCDLRDKLGARPITLVAYRREAYMSIGDDTARLTFDREVRGSDWTGRLCDASTERWCPSPIEGVILELKFTQRFPLWMAELVRRFELQRQSVPKYVRCVTRLRAPKFTQAGTLGGRAAFAG